MNKSQHQISNCIHEKSFFFTNEKIKTLYSLEEILF